MEAKGRIVKFLSDNINFQSLGWLSVNFLGYSSSNHLDSSNPRKFSVVGSYLDFLVACHLVDLTLGEGLTDDLFKNNLNYEKFKQKARDFVYKELMKNGMLKELHPDFIGGERGTHLGEKDNKLFFNLVVDTLVALTRIHRKLIIIEKEGGEEFREIFDEINSDDELGLGKYIGSVNEGFFSHTDLSQLIRDDTETSGAFRRRLFRERFQSGIPLSDKETDHLIGKLEKIKGKVENVLIREETEQLGDIIKRFEEYGKYAPYSTTISGTGSSHHPFFMAADSKTYQMYEFMKITNGFDPLGCEFYEMGQTTDDVFPSNPKGVVRGHLEGNPYVWEMVRKRSSWSSQAFWKDHVKYKFMLAPILANIHYKAPYADNEMFFNPILQARLYHLSQIAWGYGNFEPGQLEAEFRTKKVSDYIDIDKFNEHMSQDKQISEDRYLWEEFSQEDFAFIDKNVFGYDKGVFGTNPSTDSNRFNDFIRRFRENLNQRIFKGVEQWFRENLGQIELFENMQDLAGRTGSMDPNGFLIDTSYSYPELEGYTPLRPETYFEFFVTKGHYAYVYLDEDGTCEFRMSSIFDLLGLNDPFR